MAQMNSTVGDLKGNVKKMREFIDHAKSFKADFGFSRVGNHRISSQDLLLGKDFARKSKEMLRELIADNTGMAGIIGFVD